MIDRAPAQYSSRSCTIAFSGPKLFVNLVKRAVVLATWYITLPSSNLNACPPLCCCDPLTDCTLFPETHSPQRHSYNRVKTILTSAHHKRRATSFESGLEAQAIERKWQDGNQTLAASMQQIRHLHPL
jgi:hypothetical protein